MFGDRLRSLLNAVSGGTAALAATARSGHAALRNGNVDSRESQRRQPPASSYAQTQTVAIAAPRVYPPSQRSSPALEQFFRGLEAQVGLRLLDLGGVNSDNINFFTQMGQRLYSEDFFATLEDCFGEGDFYENQRDPARVESFLVQSFSELRGPYDGALVWDCLQFLRPSLLEQTIEHLHRLMEPGAYLLAYFHADERATSIPHYSFRVQDNRHLAIRQRGELPPGQSFTNRAIERLFEDFSSIKFFLSRDNIREVIVRR